MHLERIALSDLKPAEYNPRVMLRPGNSEYEALKRSIQEFGLVDPLIVNKNGIVIGGHQRLAVLADIGWTHADCVVLDIDDDREKALNIALNKIEGAWDVIKLDGILKELVAENLAEMTGFSEDELKRITAHAVKEIKTDDTEIDLEELADTTFDHKCPRCGFMF